MSSIKYKAQRVAIFIDVQNLYHSAKNLFRARVNFKNIIREGVGERQLIRAFAYVVKTEDTPGESAFFEALEHIGIELRMKDIQVFPGGLKKADWDVGMAVDAIRLAPSVDTIILVTGDGDFLPLVEYLQGHGKQVEVMAFTKSASSKLKERADIFVDLGEEPERFLLKLR
jgi:uncharacterized LabA/DUF88 family protein